ncbi:type IV toxin-antitoxin system AbiEi family antitoxin domain-containing protein [Nocardioides sp.]|uniref:type IV toxin-antitoxin system AbiEi family antitoxin domain-containing protein n=1 Tax=Nocardioides sp. TaxID=35761 RepID=UPI002733E27E|nr:type IV toxin-antitoxin system AbiEi family antitoxin domain-containing protein [Nocardioides sp.]MDP3894034.1 hypothetical protein [Nocardioides sp.]
MTAIPFLPPLPDANFPLPADAPFTRQQAVQAGVSDRRLALLCAHEVLRRPIKGVYVGTHLTDSLELRTEILKLVVPDGAFVTDRSAGWVHGAEMILAPGDHLVVPTVSMFQPPVKGRLRNKLTTSGERMLAPGDLMEVNGLLVTTPLRTALDLGRLLPRSQALAALDSLLALGAFTLRELLAQIDRFKGYRGIVQLRFLAPLADAGAESPGESALRLLWWDAGLPRPRTQIPIIVAGREVARLDLGLEDMLFAAEYDGKEWHSEPDDVDHDERRRRWLTSHHGWQIAPFVAANVYGPTRNADIVLRRAFEEARRTFPSRSYLL